MQLVSRYSTPVIPRVATNLTLARSSASVHSAFHTKLPTLKIRGWDAPVTLLPNEFQQWYPLIPCGRQEK